MTLRTSLRVSQHPLRVGAVGVDFFQPLLRNFTIIHRHVGLTLARKAELGTTVTFHTHGIARQLLDGDGTFTIDANARAQLGVVFQKRPPQECIKLLFIFITEKLSNHGLGNFGWTHRTPRIDYGKPIIHLARDPSRPTLVAKFVRAPDRRQSIPWKVLEANPAPSRSTRRHRCFAIFASRLRIDQPRRLAHLSRVLEPRRRGGFEIVREVTQQGLRLLRAHVQERFCPLDHLRSHV